MRYFLATYEILDGVHEHTGAVILQADNSDSACRLAVKEEFSPDTDDGNSYFSYDGDGLVACKNIDCSEITKAQMEFLEEVNLVHRI